MSEEERCEMCGATENLYYVEESDIEGYYCEECLEALDMAVCPVCGCAVKTEDMMEVGSQSVCNECATEMIADERAAYYEMF